MRAQMRKSDAMLETLPDGVEEVHEVDAEWFQLTYSYLRIAPDGDTLARYREDTDAWVMEDGTIWSDVTIYNPEVN